MGKFQMRHLSGGGNKQSGIMMRKGSAFPKSSALYQSETGQQEAQRKADKNNANANRVYGETTMTSKRVEGGTQKTFTTPYTTSGKGTAERSGKPNASDKDWQAFLEKISRALTKSLTRLKKDKEVKLKQGLFQIQFL